MIRRQQMEALGNAAVAAYETAMVEHCNRFSPQLCATLGEVQLRVAVRRAMHRAHRHGFTYRGPVRLFIEMTLLFGSDFDTDPQYPWAGEILAENPSELQMSRAERLFAKTIDYIGKVVGPEDRFTLQALERIRSLASAPPAFPADDLASSLLRATASTYPEKAAYVGETHLRSLFREGSEVAVTHHLRAVHDRALVCVLMFAFGHGCTNDPLYPWIGRALGDDRIPDPASRARRLEKKAITWLDHVIAWHRRGLQA